MAKKTNFPGDFQHAVTDGAVTEVSFGLYDEGVVLWPLRALPKLRKLTLRGSERTALIDLSPLIGLPIAELHCSNPVEYNLPVLRAMKSLKTINGKPASEALPP